MGAGASLSGLLADRHLGPIGFALPVLRGQLPRVDEVLELLLVLIRMRVEGVAQDPPLLGEVLEGGTRVTRGAEAKLARSLGRRQ